MSEDYTRFCENVLVAVAEAQEPPGLGILDLKALCRDRQISALPTWLELVSSDLERQGYGTDYSGKGEADFLINGAGLRRADEIRSSRKPLSLPTRVSNLNWQMWAVFVAGATLVAYILVEAVKS